MSAGFKIAAMSRRALYLSSVSSLAMLVCGAAEAGQLPVSAFTAYSASTAAAILAGPNALYSVNVNSIAPTQMNEGMTEVAKKTAGFNLATTQAALTSALLTDIEPVVIGPGGQLYLTDGHHTFTALENSVWGAANPTVYVDVIRNDSAMTQAQFLQDMQNSNLLLPLNNGVESTVNPTTGSPIPASLTGLTSNVYRGLEYSILKQKMSRLYTTTTNIAGAVGPSTAGLDKMTGYYADFISAAAYANARGGLGLPTLSPGDILLASTWNLTGANTTSIPSYTYTNVNGVQTLTANANVAYTVNQLPGYILPAAGITITRPVTNSDLITVSGTTSTYHVLDGSVTGATAAPSFGGLVSMNLGNATLGNSIANTAATALGFVLQLGYDNGGAVTLQSTANTYIGGTTIEEGRLIIMGDGSLGAAPPASYNSATFAPGSDVIGNVRAANGIVFNSLSEGTGALQLGANLVTSRPIAICGEIATLDMQSYSATLNGPLLSMGAGGGLGNATGNSDLTVTGNSAASVLTLNAASPQFYGNLIISGGTVVVSSDAQLGAITGPVSEIGQVDLDGGNLKLNAANFTSVRGLTVTSKGSTLDANGNSGSFAGTFTASQRPFTLGNSSTTSAGSLSFGSLVVGTAEEMTVNGGSQGLTVNLTGGITRTGNAAFFINPYQGTTLGTTEKVLSAGASATTTNGIVAPWIVIDTNSVAAATTPVYDFATYSATNGYQAATYSANAITASTASNVVKAGASAALGATAQAYALNVQSGVTISGSTSTLTLGDGTNPAGLIMNGGTISAKTLAFGASEAVVSIAGSNTISSQITGSGGVTLTGAGSLTLSTAMTDTGLVTVNTGTLTLGVANALASSTSGVYLQDTKNLGVQASGTTAKLAIATGNQTVSALSSAGTNSTVTLATGTSLTIGDGNNLNSTLSSAITESGTAVTGALTKNGTGMLDLSAMSKGTLTLISGSTVVVNAGTLRLTAASFKNTNGITLNNGTEVQFAEGGGSLMAGNVTGSGTLHLIGGTLVMTGTGNTYTGGAVVEAGSTLDLSTASVSTGNANIANAGGMVVFDQNTTGTYSGVISDAAQMEGTGSALAGSVVIDDSGVTAATTPAGNVTFSAKQTYTGATYVEAGTLTLGTTDAIKASSGVTLGRVGYSTTASLVLGADNTLQSLNSNPGGSGVTETTAVTLGGHTLTLGTTSGSNPNANSTFAGNISGGTLVKAGSGIAVLSGANSFTAQSGTGSAVSVVGGTLVLSGTDSYSANGSSAALASVASGATLQGTTTNLASTIANNGTVVFNLSGNATYAGTLTGSGSIVATGTGTLTLTNAFGGYAAGSTITASLLGGGTPVTPQPITTATTVGTDNSSGTYAKLAGSATLTKSGSGTLTIQSDNSSTFTGGVQVTGGGMQVASGAKLGSSSAVTVGDSAGHTASTFTVQSGGEVDAPLTVNDINATMVINSGGAVVSTVNVATGVARDNGTITGNVTVGSGGSFGGGGTVNGTVTIAAGGILSPGASPATTTVAGTVTQGDSSTLNLDVDGTGTGSGAGNYSRLIVTGAGNQYAIGNTVTIQANLRGITGAANNTFSPPLGTDLTVVSAAGGVTGSFASITQPGSGLLAGTQFNLIYGATTVELVATPIAYGNLAAAGLSPTANQSSVGAAIDQFRSLNAADLRTGSDMGQVLANLYRLPSGSIQGALNQISGASHPEAISASAARAGALSQALDGRTTALRDGTTALAAMSGTGNVQLAYSGGLLGELALADSAEQGDAGPGGNHLWGRGLGMFTHTTDQAGASVGSQTGGAVVGIDGKLATNLTAGVAAAVTKSFVDGGSKVTGYSASLYGNYDLNPVFVSGNLGTTLTQYDSSRTIAFGGLSRTATGTTVGNDVSAGIKSGYREKLDDGTLLEPAVGVDWTHVHQNGFGETGAGVLDLRMSGVTQNFVQTSLGGRASHSFDAGEGTKIEPEVRAAWTHDLLDRTVTENANLNGAAFAVTGSHSGRDGALVGVGLAIGGDNSTKVYLDYNADIRSNEIDHMASAGIRLTW